jgi:YkoY family integral membrane protein
MDFALITQLTTEFQNLVIVDALTIGTLVILEGILSVDNALVLAILVRSLPKRRRKKALTYGIFGAFIFRFLALVFAAYLMNLRAFKLIGGGYLVYLSMKHMFFFYKEDAYQPRLAVASSFWKTVAIVELTDIAFSIDSITTAVAMSDKLLVVWTGGILGIISLRLVSAFFVRLLEKLPKLEDLAYQLIFFVGTKLALEGLHVTIEAWVFWLMMGVIALLGGALVYRDQFQRKTQTQFQNHLLSQIKNGEINFGDLLALECVPSQILQYLQDHNCLSVKTPCPAGVDGTLPDPDKFADG